VQVVLPRHDQIDVARQRKVLESIVEDMNGRAQTAFGQAAGQKSESAPTATMTPGRRAPAFSGSSPAAMDVGKHAPPIRYDRDAAAAVRRRVSARQNGRTFTPCR